MEETAAALEAVVTAREAAAIKGTTRQAVYGAIRDGKLRARQSGNTMLILKSDLSGWIVVGGKRPKPKKHLDK